MPDLEPITRDEKLWSGEDLEPITRREMYIKHLYDETQVIPDKPITREEMFILKAGEELHDVTIEQLTATENRTYSEKGVAYSPVIVNVPQPTLTTLDVTENGTYTAPSGTAYSEVDVDVPLPENAYLLKEIENVEIATFTDGSDLPMPKLEVAVEPQQDLHGYDSPWVGGVGKNKLPLTVDGIKGANGGANTWSGNSKTINDITFTIQTNSNGDVIGINVNGTASATATLFLVRNDAQFANVLQDKSVTLNGSPNGATDNTYGIQGYKVVNKSGSVYNESTFTFDVDASSYFVGIYVISGQTVNNLIFKPMIRLATVSDATFAPYSNICPISGWSAVDVTVADDVDNPTTTKTITIQLGDTYYGGKLDVVSGVLTVDRAEIDLGSRTYTKAVDGYFYAYISDISIINFNANEPTAECEIYKLCTSAEWYDRTIDSGIFGVESSHVIYVADSRFSDGDSLKTALTGKKLVYTLATPTTIQLTPTQVSSLMGVNNIWADCGKIIDGQYFSKGE